MYNGIDVSIFQNSVDWKMVRASGIRFAMIKASQGFSEKGNSYLFVDRCFRKNITEAAGAGLYCGTYHYLTAKNVWQAKEEARHYLATISPYRALHLLWAAVDVESDKYLPSDQTGLCAAVDSFCGEISKAGFVPMVYTNPNYIKYKFRMVPKLDLWLAQWRDVKYGIPKGYSRLRIWQYGTSMVSGINGGVDSDIGNFWLPDQDFRA